MIWTTPHRRLLRLFKGNVRNFLKILLAAGIISACSAEGNFADDGATFKFDGVKLSEIDDLRIKSFLNVCGKVIDAGGIDVESHLETGWKVSSSTLSDDGAVAFQKAFGDFTYEINVQTIPLVDPHETLMCHLKAVDFETATLSDLPDIKAFNRIGLGKAKIHEIEGGNFGEWSVGSIPNIVTVGAEVRAGEYRGGKLNRLMFYVTTVVPKRQN